MNRVRRVERRRFGEESFEDVLNNSGDVSVHGVAFPVYTLGVKVKQVGLYASTLSRCCSQLLRVRIVEAAYKPETKL